MTNDEPTLNEELALLANAERAYQRARCEVFDVAASNDTTHLSKHQRQLLVDLEAAQIELTRYRRRRAGL